MQIYWTKIIKIVDETPEVKTYFLECPKDFTWEEGAHVHLALEGFNAGEKPNRGLVRHMSISTLPNEKSVGITTRMKEKGSEFKSALRKHKVGDKVALFKIHSNIPLRRENKTVYLLSAGVGLATFRPLVLEYFNRADKVNHIHSLNVDSSKNFLFPDIFAAGTNTFTSEFVDNRKDYYEKVEKLASDKNSLFYIVGSDEFLVQNIALLREQGIQSEQIKLDKHERRLPDFLASETA